MSTQAKPRARVARVARMVGRAGVAAALVSLLTTSPVWAWDPATTHAGLTERALAASKFHAVMARQMGRALGGFEPLRLGALDPDLMRALKARLDALDPSGGYRPSSDNISTASGWVEAGAVLAKTPPERGRNHFLEPKTRSGLDDDRGLSGTIHAVRLTLDEGATVRDTATGQAFALQGMSSLDWLTSEQNDLGLTAFFDQWEATVSAPQASARETALVRALLALGGTLAVLEDAGQPAFVRNDFRGEFLGSDNGSAFERFVADTYGHAALPKSTAPASRATWQSYFVAEDGKGLAQRTQASFFSPGTLPKDGRCDDAAPADVVRSANQSLSFPEPSLTTLELGGGHGVRYVKKDGVRVLAYQRTGSNIHFFLDKTVYADVAQHWLPEVEGYAAGLVDHLMRAKVSIQIASNKATITVDNLSGNIESGTLVRVFAEAADGSRRAIAKAPLVLGQAFSSDIPEGTRKIAVAARGRDGAGPFVAVGEAVVP
jgi:hypothetical protein